MGVKRLKLCSSWCIDLSKLLYSTPQISERIPFLFSVSSVRGILGLFFLPTELKRAFFLCVANFFFFSPDFVAVGFSDRGSAPGADLCLLWDDGRGRKFLTDVHTVANASSVAAPDGGGRQDCEDFDFRYTIRMERVENLMLNCYLLKLLLIKNKLINNVFF